MGPQADRLAEGDAFIKIEWEAPTWIIIMVTELGHGKVKSIE